MRTLFLKIFLWFWAAMALVVLAIILTYILLNLLQEERLQQEANGPTRVFAETAAKTFEREGGAALGGYLARIENQARQQAYLFDANGMEVSARNAPAEVSELARQVLAGKQHEFTRPNPERLIVVRVNAPSGAGYVMVSKWLLPRRRPFVPETRILLLQLVAVIVTVGLVCFWLARHLTKPVVQLRAAAHKLAEGDLSARVGDSRRRDELADLGRDFDRMAERIETLLQSQQRLLGDISHELRSPLARLNLALGVARRKAGPEASAAHDRIAREAERLNELIGQLLTLTQLETGVDETPTEPIELAQLVEEIVADADFEAHSHSRAVKLTATTECRLNGNRDLLRSAIENVVRNAVRYTAPNTTVEVGLSEANGNGHKQAVIRVRDYGPGVPDDALQNIFRPFYRVADARDRESGGTGLGLAITERAVRLHSGNVVAENVPDGGLSITLSLPIGQG
jgi:two-component system sensor histidine kinase CpxA